MILRAKNLSKAFHHPKKFQVLSDISLDIQAGESIAICGRSGEGKTTLLHILGTLEQADSGTLEIGGKRVNISNMHSLRNRHLGFIFQSYNLLEDFTALENVLMPARIARLPIDRKKGMTLLEQVGMEERADFPAKLLSGGEKQRITIARALCNDPDLILADEPSGNLDKANALIIGNLLMNLVHTQKKGLILVTHDTEFANQCDRRYLLHSGNLVS